jgi:hypothetical protein
VHVPGGVVGGGGRCLLRGHAPRVVAAAALAWSVGDWGSKGGYGGGGGGDGTGSAAAAWSQLAGQGRGGRRRDLAAAGKRGKECRGGQCG